MTFTRKFSEFPNGTLEQDVGLAGGANTRAPAPTGSGGTIETITQDTSGLTVGYWVRFDNATQLYVNALADTPEHAEVYGVVLKILSGNQFELQQSGPIPHGTPGFSGFSTTGTYFLSDVTPGLQTLTPPTINGHVRLPLFMADSADSGWVASLKTGMVIGSPGPIPSSGGAGTDTSIHVVHQPGNTFNIGDWVRVSADMVYSLADGSSFANSQGVGVVTAAGDPNFTVQFSGYNIGAVMGAVDSVGAPVPIVTPGVYYLSDVVPGKITLTKPSANFTSVKPSFISESAINNTGWILPQQPLEVEPGSSDPSFVTVHQVAHGFTVENVLRVLGSGTYTKALADSLSNALAVGIVVEVIDADNFVLQTEGFTDKFSGKTAAVQYYLSDVTPGLLTTTEPTTSGHASKPMFEALTTTSGYIREWRPLLQPNANGGGGGGGSYTIGNVVSVTNNVNEINIPVNSTLPGLTITITPSAITSKVLLTASINIANGGGHLSLMRNGVKIPEASTTVNEYSFGGSAAVFGQEYSLTFLDAPNTTLPCVYTIYNSPAISFTMNRDGISTLTGMLLEL